MCATKTASSSGQLTFLARFRFSYKETKKFGTLSGEAVELIDAGDLGRAAATEAKTKLNLELNTFRD